MSAVGSIEQVRLCAEQDVPVREGKVVRVGDRPLAVFHTDDGFRAIDNTCTHMGGTLADGLVADATVACPLHDRRFDLATGRAVGHDCGSVSAYPVEVRDGAVYAFLPVFVLGDVQTVVGGASTDDEVTDDGEDAGGGEGTDDEVTAPVETEERGEGPEGEDAADPSPSPGASGEDQGDGPQDGDDLPATAERPIEAKAGLREAESAPS